MGLDHSLGEIYDLIVKAKHSGFDRIFTSLHIPEADYEKVTAQFKKVVEFSKGLGMKVIADISPLGFQFLGMDNMDTAPLKKMGIDVLRLDFGYSPNEIARFTNNEHGIKIEINASTVTERFFVELEKHSPNHANLQACHNYYPRRNTGISEETFISKNEMIREKGLRITAFIPSLTGRRGPVYEGLPTLEKHREQDPYLSAKHLFALGADDVFFGDGMPSEEELEKVGALKEDGIELRTRSFDESPAARKYLSHPMYSNRSDCAEDAVRAVEGRGLLGEGETVHAANCMNRKKGSITLDNSRYLRYMGELQILLRDLPADERVNVIGEVIEEDLFLLDYIKDETKFCFKVLD